MALWAMVGFGAAGVTAQATVPKLDAGVSLADARLSRLVRKRVEKVVLIDNVITDPYAQGDVLEATKVVSIRLRPGKRLGLRVWGGGLICGKSNCPFWIFDPANGYMLFAGNGYRLDFQRTLHHGLFDIKTTHQLGATSGQYDYYQFDGRQYQQVNTVVYGP